MSGAASSETLQPRARFLRGRSIWADAARGLVRDPRGIFGLAIVVIFTLLAIFGPALAPHDPRRLHFDKAYAPPAWQEKSAVGGESDPAHPLGTDGQGRDVLSRALYGTRTSMLIGWATVLFALLIGLPIGLLSGYHGGRIDTALMRITDVFYALPTIMLYILIVLLLRDTKFGAVLNGVAMLILAFAIVGWVGIARLSRSATLVARNAAYVDAANAAGAPAPRLIFHHILPNILGPVLVWVAAAVPGVIIIEGILGYLRIGISPPTDPDKFFSLSWGGLFLEGRAALHAAPWVFAVPAISLALLSIGFTFLGDSLRDTLDPTSRSR